MATVNLTTTDTWAKIVNDAVEFLLENPSLTKTAYVCFDSGTPADGAPAHILRPGMSLIRAGVSGDLWVRGHEGTPLTLSTE